MNDNKNAFDLWWEWAEKPLDSRLTIDAAIHDAVMALPPDERRDRPPQRGADAAMSRLVIAAGLKLNVVPIDSTWTRRSLASGSRNRLPTPAEPVRVAPASASRSGPVPRVGAPERRW